MYIDVYKRLAVYFSCIVPPSYRRHTGGANVDMSMAPAQGLSSPALSTTDIGEGGETGPRGVPMATIRDVARAIEDQLVSELYSSCIFVCV